MNNLSFIKQYLKNPKTIGAIMPSSKYLAHKMIEDIDFNHSECIIEYGSGTGVFTEGLVKNKSEDTKLLLFEYNEDFWKLLKDKFGNEKNVFIINDSCENIDTYLLKYNINNVDYIISGLPFASLPQKISEKILTKTRKVLKNDGNFITFQYTLLKKDFIKRYFKYIDLKREFKNIPPAYVFNCVNCK